MDVEKLASAYLRIRDTLSELTKKYEEQKAALEKDQEVIKQYFLEKFKKDGNVTSISTPIGTIVRTVKTRVWTNDWEEMHKLILEKGNLDLLERRLSQSNMAAFLEANPGSRPAGLNIDRKYDVSIRRK